MNESDNRARRASAILLGLLLIGAGLVWSLFWLFGLAWAWPPEIAIAVFLGLCFALGVVALLLGLLLVWGRLPGRRGWLTVGAIALTPLALLAPVGLSTSSHRSDVEAVATRALAARRGASNLAANCVWEYDEEDAEYWRCDMGTDSCLVRVTERDGGLRASTDATASTRW